MSKKLIFDETFCQEVIKFYLAPNSLNETFKHFNLNNRKTVQNILNEHNIPQHTKEICERLKQQKIKQTNLMKYGVECSWQSPVVKEKIKETMFQRYGGYTLQSQKLLDKVNTTNLIRYGRTNLGQFGTYEHNSAIKIKYGVEHICQNSEIKDKIKQTNLKKYGTTVPMNCDTIQEKIKQDNIKKYGVEYYLQSDDKKEKSKQTNLKKYGVENFAQSPKNYKYHKTSYYYNDESFDSFPELCLYIYCVDNNISIERCLEKFTYEYEGKKHYYIPDFIVNNEIVEIKGNQFLKDDGTWCNVYDRLQDGLYEAKHQCAIKNNVKVLYISEYKKYIDYFNSKYNKEDFLRG